MRRQQQQQLHRGGYRGIDLFMYVSTWAMKEGRPSASMFLQRQMALNRSRHSVACSRRCSLVVVGKGVCVLLYICRLVSIVGDRQTVGWYASVAWFRSLLVRDGGGGWEESECVHTPMLHATLIHQSHTWVGLEVSKARFMNSE